MINSLILFCTFSGLFPFSDVFADPFNTDDFVGIAEKVIPTVANLSSVSTVEKPLLIPYPFDELFFGRQRPMVRLKSLGSALLIDSSGIFLTNYHVIEGMTEVKIMFKDLPDEKPMKGQVIARDPDLDIALIKVELSQKIPAAILGDSSKLRVGEFVLALGNPFGQGHAVSHGILSAKERSLPGGPYGGFLQTDVPINPGNSGGPLLNMRGEVVGINSAIQFNAQGISYAIPIDSIKAVLPELKTKGVVERGYLGFLIENLRPEIAKQMNVPAEATSPIVTTVYEHGPSSKAGMLPYDLILALNDQSMKGAMDVMSALQKSRVGDRMEFKVLRSGKEKRIFVVVEKKEVEDRYAIQKQEKENAIIHPLSGLRVEIFADREGIQVTGVIPGSPADLAGIELGDVLLEMDRKPLKDVLTYRSLAVGQKKHLLRLIRTRFGKDACTIIELDMG